MKAKRWKPAYTPGEPSTVYAVHHNHIVVLPRDDPQITIATCLPQGRLSYLLVLKDLEYKGFRICTLI